MLEWIQKLDIQVLTELRELFCTPWLDTPMKLISGLGNNGFLWIAIGAVLLILGNRTKPWRQWGAVLLGSLALNAVLCNIVLKPLVARTRPYDLLGYTVLVPPLSDFSFPSGHTSAAFAGAAVIYAMHRRWGIAAYLFAILMGFSRLYLGVHFPADVLAGALLGWAAARAVIFAADRIFAPKGAKNA